MEDPTAAPDRRTLTPAIVASAVFAAACAVFAIAFVGARGGLQLPVAATGPPVAIASSAPSPSVLGPSVAPTISASPVAPTLPPTIAPTPSPTATPSTPVPTALATFAIPTLEPGDPLLVLPGCPGHPGCFEYTVARGDTLSGIISRYLLDIDVLQALDPGRLENPNLVVVGELLYLGRDPLARLDPCPNGEACALYVVAPGDSLAEIADRYLLTREAVLAANPGLDLPLQVGQVIKLPRLPAP